MRPWPSWKGLQPMVERCTAEAIARLREALPDASHPGQRVAVLAGDLRRVLALVAEAPALHTPIDRPGRPCEGCPSDCDLCITE